MRASGQRRIVVCAGVLMALTPAHAPAVVPVRALQAVPGSSDASAPGLSVSATVEQAQVTTVQSVVLAIEVRAGGLEVAGLEPEPVAGEPLGDFTVAWVRREPPAVVDGAVVHRWAVGLEPFLPGTARIPAFGVVVAGLAGPVPGVTSEPIEVEVTSVLDEAGPFEPAQLRPPLEPLPDTGETGATWVWIAAGTLLTGGAVATGLAIRRPTPERRLRRTLAPVEQQAAALGRTRPAPKDADAHAEAVLAVIRQAAAILMGDRTHAMTPPEFTGALAAQAPDVGPADLERLARLLDWHEARTYAGLAPPPPQLPDVTRVVGAIQAAAVAAVRGRVIHGRTEVPA